MTNMLLILTVVSSIALDPSTVIEIEADTSTQNLKTSKSEWTGNVVAREGPYTLSADVLRLEYQDNKPCRLIAVGKPVLANGPVDGEAAQAQGEVLLYDCTHQKARLARNATLSTGNQNIRAENIIYDFIQRKLSATGADKSTVNMRFEQRKQPDT